MKKFKFKFEAVERVRKSREEEALRLLGQAQRQLQEAIQLKNKLISELNAALLRRENLANEAVSVIAFQVEEDFITGTKQRIIQAEQGIRRATRGVEKALRTYLHAKRQLKTIETLREKSLADYRKERARWEQRQSDDLTVMRQRLLAEETVA